MDYCGNETLYSGITGQQMDVKIFMGPTYYMRLKHMDKDNQLSLYNCTEGGIFLKGFNHISLKKFIDEQLISYDKNTVDTTFNGVKRNLVEYKKKKEKLTRFIKKNIDLGKEVDRLSKIAVGIAKKSYQTDEDLRRFDSVQNKTIKKLTKNYFYTLGLQKEIYILQAGIAADNSIEGQLGFHLDFLKAVRIFNHKFRSAFSKQSMLISSNC